MSIIKIGDKVVVKADEDEIIVEANQLKKEVVYIVKDIEFSYLSNFVMLVTKCGKRAFIERFELYKEPSEDVMNQQTQQKTKRVPFSNDTWIKNKVAKVVWTPTDTEILYFDKWGGYDFIGVYKAPGEEYAATTFQNADFPNMAIEIPVTTKRIPFNPELKDAKVFYGKTELIEWVQMKTSPYVAGVYKPMPNSSVLQSFEPSALEMEIEEDV